MKKVKLISVVLTCDDLLWILSMPGGRPVYISHFWNNSWSLTWLVPLTLPRESVSNIRHSQINTVVTRNKKLSYLRQFTCYLRRGGLRHTTDYISPVRHVDYGSILYTLMDLFRPNFPKPHEPIIHFRNADNHYFPPWQIYPSDWPGAFGVQLNP